jgi:CheY-like chemotaxis protein
MRARVAASCARAERYDPGGLVGNLGTLSQDGTTRVTHTPQAPTKDGATVRGMRRHARGTDGAFARGMTATTSQSSSTAPPFDAPTESPDEPLILIAEDDDELRRLLADTLEDHGYVVRSAADGKGLLAMLSAVSRGELPTPWLIVMDVRMPACGGMEVLSALRLAEWDVPVVMITAFGDTDLHREAGRRGATIMLDKPFELDTLVCVARALAAPPISFDEDDDDVTAVTRRVSSGGAS